MRIRLYGLALLLVSAAALYLLHQMAGPAQLSGPGALQMLAAVLAVLTGFPGASLLFVGPALFEQVERPNYRPPPSIDLPRDDRPKSKRF